MPKGDELTVINSSNLDIPLPAQEAIAIQLGIVNDVLRTCRESNNPEEAFRYGRWLITTVRAQGVGLAELLYGLWQIWSDFGLEEEFEDRVYAEWGITPGITKKYVRSWRSVFDNPNVPDDVKSSLRERSMHTINRLSSPARNDILTKKDWQEIAVASDHHAIVQIIEKRAGKPKRGTRPLTITLYSDGQVIAFYDDERVSLGVLRNSKEDMKNEIRWKAINKIVKGAGMMEKSA